MRRQTYDLRLTSAEAVVLFAMLHRLNDSGCTELVDDAEQRVTENLLGLLEGALTERIELGYEDAVTRAKSRLVSGAH